MLCTDPVVLESIVRAVGKATLTNQALETVKITRHRDIADQLHGLTFTEVEEPEYRRLAWWMFRALCDQGWEPMETGELSFKLKLADLP